jgi:hypothetical protein
MIPYLLQFIALAILATDVSQLQVSTVLLIVRNSCWRLLLRNCVRNSPCSGFSKQDSAERMDLVAIVANVPTLNAYEVGEDGEDREDVENEDGEGRQ